MQNAEFRTALAVVFVAAEARVHQAAPIVNGGVMFVTKYPRVELCGCSLSILTPRATLD